MLLVTAGAPSPLAARLAPAGTIVDRFLARQDAALTQYRGSRRLEARNARFKMTGWLDVETELTDGVFRYRVVAEGGSSYIRNKVLRRALDGEREMFANGDPARAAFTLDNYALHPGQASAEGELMLMALPKRKDVLLVSGSLVVTPDGDLVRVEGTLSQSPSFWTRDIHVVRAYGRVGGVRVPLSLESTARVRIAGTSTLTMRYGYREVNGVDVTAEASDDALKAPEETVTALP